MERLVHPIRHRAVDGLKLWFQRSSGLAHLHLHITPTSRNELQPDGCPPGMAISFDGRLDNREDLVRNLPRRSPQDLQNLTDAACALAAYCEFGESFAQHLRGDFAIALVDGARQKLLLARDIMGICPLYYSQTQNTFFAGSEIKSILAYPGFKTRPDDDALADLLLAGDPYDRERTCFAGISRVLPGHTVVVTPEKMRSFQHWDFDTAKQIRCGSIEDYAERLRTLFKQAVRRRLRSSHPVAVTVSGGLDSSAILCQAELLKRAEPSVAPCLGISMTFPDGTDADEKQFLHDIEDCYKIRIRKLAFSRVRFAECEKSIWNSEMPQLDWDARCEIRSTVRQMGCRVVLDGYYGDQMLANAGYLVDLARSFRWFQLRREFAEYCNWMAEVTPAIMRQELRWILSRGLVPYKLVRRVRQYQGIMNSRHPSWYAQRFREHAFQRYVVSKRTPRHFISNHAKTCFEFLTARPRLNCVEADNKTAAIDMIEKSYPFMDTDLIEFVLALPGHVVNWRGVPKGLFREAMKGILPESIRLRNWKGDFTLLNNEAASSDYPNFQRYLGPDCLAVMTGFMDPIGLQNEFPNRRFDRNNGIPAGQVTAAVALELWLRVFWEGKEFSSLKASTC